MSVMNEKIEKLQEIVDRQKQYFLCNCLFLHGIAENEGENTKLSYKKIDFVFQIRSILKVQA